MSKINLNALIALVVCAAGIAKAVTCHKALQGSTVEYAPKIVIISGTNREGSNTLKVAKQASEIFQSKGAEVTLLDVSQVSPQTFSSKNYWNTPKTFQKKFDAPLNAADAVVFIFPEYNGTYPGILGTFINYLQVSFQGKPIGLVGLSAGILGAQKGADHLSSMLRHMKADIVGEAQVNLPEVEKLLMTGRIAEASLLERFDRSANALISRVKQKKQTQRQVNEMLEIVKGNKTILTFDLNSGLQVRGVLAEVRKDKKGEVYFLKWEGGTEMLNSNQVIPGQGRDRHGSGFSSPIGPVQTAGGLRSLSTVTSIGQLSQFGLVMGQKVEIKYQSGIVIQGVLRDAIFNSEQKLQMLTLDDTTVTSNQEILYRPEWGPFDLAIGDQVQAIRR